MKKYLITSETQLHPSGEIGATHFSGVCGPGKFTEHWEQPEKRTKINLKEEEL